MSDSLVVALLGIQWLCIFALAVLVIATMRHLAFLYERLDPVFKFQTSLTSLRVGELPPTLGLTNLRNEPETPEAWLGTATIVLFAQPQCGACGDLLRITRDAVNRAVKAHGIRVRVVVLGDREAATHLQRGSRLDDAVEFLADTRALISERWAVTKTPSALVLGPDGRVVEKLGTLSTAQFSKLLEPRGPYGAPSLAPTTESKIGG